MTLNLQHYFTSPVEAVKVTADNMEEVAAWCGGRVATEHNKNTGKDDPYVWVPTPDGSRISWAFKNMWITRRCVISMKGEIKFTYSVFRVDYFRKNYFESPNIAVEETWEKAERQRQNKKGRKKQTPKPAIVGNVGEELKRAQAAIADLSAKIDALTKPSDYLNPQDDQEMAEKMIEASEAGTPEHDALVQEGYSALEGKSEAEVERILNVDEVADHLKQEPIVTDEDNIIVPDAPYLHVHKFDEECDDACAVREAPGTHVFKDRTLSNSKYGRTVEIESMYEELMAQNLKWDGEN
jgi:hypothetical protein